MKNLKFGLLLVFVILACGSSAWATYILKVDSYEMYLRQGDYCPADANTYCNDNLNYLVSTYWSNPNSSLPLKLGSDIDLGELKSDGTCISQHTPLKYSAARDIYGNAPSFDGNGYTIKNMCYVYDIKSGAMSAPVGFFESIDHASITNVKFQNVHIAIKDSRTGVDPASAGQNFYPVGVLAGYINMSYVGGGSLSDVTVNAPFAGGLAGYIASSTVENFVAEDDIIVFNNLELTGAPSNFAGSKFAASNYSSMWGSRYTVFLGGVSGVAHHVTFKTLSVQASVSDSSSANTPSAIGGVAGVYTYAGNMSNNPEELSVTLDSVVMSKNDDSTSFTKLYGGSAMGGMFGESNIFGEDRSVGNLTIQNSSAIVRIRGAASDSVFVGGLIGRCVTPLGSSIKFDANQVVVDAKDTLASEFDQHYFVGGTVGYLGAGAINGGNASGDQPAPTFKASKVSGTILVDGISSNRKSNVYLGGFVGSVAFPWNEHGLSNDTANVTMLSRAIGVDSVFVGGLVGFSNIDGNGGGEGVFPKVVYKNDVFRGSITIEEDASTTTYAGGIVGMFKNSDGQKFVRFDNMVVEGEEGDVITIKNAAVNDMTKVTSVGGICGYCTFAESASKMSVIGNVSVSGSVGKDSVYAGSIYGTWLSSYGKTILTNTFSRGSVNVPNGESAKAGYLAGAFFGNDSLIAAYNYHYSKAELVKPFGILFHSGWDYADTWTQKDFCAFKYNIRNGQSSDLDEKNNGELAASVMQKQSFAGFMNTDQDPYLWSFATDLNDNLPFFDAANPVKPSQIATHTVTFKNYDGTVLAKSSVMEGANAVAPTVPNREGYTFAGWDVSFTNVTGDITVTARYDANIYVVTFYDYDAKVLSQQNVKYGDSAKAPAEPTREDSEGIAYTFKGWSADFSVVTGDMSVIAQYEGSAIPSSSSEEPRSSSSSVEPESSSSVEKVLEIVEPRIDQSGNAIRLTFGTNNFDVANKTSARVVVLGDEGVYMDTVLTDSITDAAARGEWVLSPAPIGKFTVKLVLASDVAADSCEKGFTVSGEIEVQPRSWQMIALSALDMAALRDKDDAAFYWWDEVNPIGDYWQYRAYEESAEYNETQGFWYGTKDGNPLKLKAETPTQDAEIVWELDNRYSGWNLVANPHGWYVNMQDAEKCDAEFWRWNPVTAEYETVAILAPYEAIWAKVNAPTTCRISSAPDFSIAMEGAEEPETLAKKALAKSSKGMDWSLRAVLADASGKKDSWNVIGSGNGANMEEPPAGMGDHVNLSIVEGKSRFAKFVKAAAESYSWNMEVNASSARDGFLSFEGLETLAAKGMKVFVTVDGKTTEMTNGKSVPVSLKKDSKTVTVQVSKSAPVVSSNALKGLRAVQQGGSLQIGFTADGMNGTQGLVQLVGVNGKIAATSKFTAVGGANLVTVAAPKSGVYFLRVKVGSQMTSAKFLVK